MSRLPSRDEVNAIFGVSGACAQMREMLEHTRIRLKRIHIDVNFTIHSSYNEVADTSVSSEGNVPANLQREAAKAATPTVNKKITLGQRIFPRRIFFISVFFLSDGASLPARLTSQLRLGNPFPSRIHSLRK